MENMNGKLNEEDEIEFDYYFYSLIIAAPPGGSITGWVLPFEYVQENERKWTIGAVCDDHHDKCVKEGEKRGWVSSSLKLHGACIWPDPKYHLLNLTSLKTAENFDILFVDINDIEKYLDSPNDGPKVKKGLENLKVCLCTANRTFYLFEFSKKGDKKSIRKKYFDKIPFADFFMISTIDELERILRERFCQVPMVLAKTFVEEREANGRSVEMQKTIKITKNIQKVTCLAGLPIDAAKKLAREVALKGYSSLIRNAGSSISGNIFAKLNEDSIRDFNIELSLDLAFTLFQEGSDLARLNSIDACHKFKESWNYARMIINPEDKAMALYQVSNGFHKIRYDELAHQSLVESLNSAEDIENSLIKAGPAHAIGQAFREMNDRENAFRAFRLSLNSVREIRDPAFYAHLNLGIGKSFQEIGYREEALQAFNECFDKAKKIDNSIFGLHLMELLSDTYRKIDEYDKANFCIEKSVDIAKEREKFIQIGHERDLDAYIRKLLDSEILDVTLQSMRGCTVHGHSLRLEENGMMFDMLARTEMVKDGNVYVVKDRIGIPLDKKINLGKPMSEAEAKRRTTIFRYDGIPMCGKVGTIKHDEAAEALHKMWELRSRWGFRPV
jgi:methyl coenzyme M reductase gamma subunit